MAKQKVEVEVTKEAYELGQAVYKIVGAVKTALADGWQPGTDVPTIAMTAMAELAVAVQGVDQIPEESKDLAPFIEAWLVSAMDTAKLFMPPPPVA